MAIDPPQTNGGAISPGNRMERIEGAVLRIESNLLEFRLEVERRLTRLETQGGDNSVQQKRAASAKQIFWMKVGIGCSVGLGVVGLLLRLLKVGL